MSEDRRNPYLILGINFDASLDEASRAFARTMARVRRTEAEYLAEDVNWALHRVEQVLEDPQTSVDVFRVPANADVFEVTGEVSGASPAPANLARMIPETRASEVEELARRALAELVYVIARKHGAEMQLRIYEDEEG